MSNAMKTYGFDELFYPLEKGTSKLTEQQIYKSLIMDGELVPIWGGNQEHESVTSYVNVNARNKDDAAIRIFEGDCLIVSLDGSAGSMTFKPKGSKFALNHHAGVLKLKDPKILDLRYFKYKFENKLRSLAVSDGSKTLSKRQLEVQTFDLPGLSVQLKILERYEQLANLQKKLNQTKSELDALLSKEVVA